MPAWSTFSGKTDLITMKDQLLWLAGYYGSKEERGERLPPLVAVCLPVLVINAARECIPNLGVYVKRMGRAPVHRVCKNA